MDDTHKSRRVVAVPFHGSHKTCDDFFYVRPFWLRKIDRSFSCAYALFYYYPWHQCAQLTGAGLLHGWMWLSGTAQVVWMMDSVKFHWGLCSFAISAFRRPWWFLSAVDFAPTCSQHHFEQMFRSWTLLSIWLGAAPFVLAPVAQYWLLLQLSSQIVLPRSLESTLSQ